MKNLVGNFFRDLLRAFGVDVIRYKKYNANISCYPPDFNNENIRIYETVKAYTLTSMERINAVVEAVKYLDANGIKGAFVECGVWKGGSSMAMALALKKLNDTSRDIYLYDTFSGMSAPADIDISFMGEKANEKFNKLKTSDNSSTWDLSPLEEVKKNLYSTSYPKEKLFFVKGMVENTIPRSVPEEIALLRLDTDWYESTKHELIHLFPRLKVNGILIIDDYGHWKGAAKAVDEYIKNNSIRIFLNRIDYTGRIAVKT